MPLEPHRTFPEPVHPSLAHSLHVRRSRIVYLLATWDHRQGVDAARPLDLSLGCLSLMQNERVNVVKAGMGEGTIPAERRGGGWGIQTWAAEILLPINCQLKLYFCAFVCVYVRLSENAPIARNPVFISFPEEFE
jgi:hypothetical protein